MASKRARSGQRRRRKERQLAARVAQTLVPRDPYPSFFRSGPPIPIGDSIVLGMRSSDNNGFRPLWPRT